MKGGRRLLTLLTLLQTLHIAAWSAYYAITRRVYSGDESFLIMLASAETLPTVASIAGGLLAEKRGYRVVFVVGVFEGLFLSLTGLWLHSRRLLWLSAFLASMFWSIAGPQVLGYVLTFTGLSGRSLAIVLAGGAIGWSVGGAAAPILAESWGGGPVLIVSGVIVAAIYVSLVMLPELKPRQVLRGWRRKAKAMAVVAVPVSFALVGTEILGSLYLAKLSREFPATLYALGIALSGVTSALSRPYIGALVDRLGERRLLPLALTAYALYTPLLMYTHGWLFFAAWLLPIYPMLDINLYKYAARFLGEALGSSIVSASYSVAGLILVTLGRAELSFEAYNLAAIAFFIAATLLTIASYKVLEGQTGGEA